MQNKQKEYKECLKALLEIESGLNDWELSFIESLAQQETFSTKQGKKVIEIYDKHTKNM